MKKLKIDLTELELAFGVEEMSGMESYLDTESGEVYTTTEDDRSALRDFFEEADAEETEVEERFEKWLEGYDCPDWQIDSIRIAFMIERSSPKRFITIPKQDSRSGYKDMVDFAETVTDDRLQESLFIALDGKGAFRRFKNVLNTNPKERERFFEFSAKRFEGRIKEWLVDNDIELEN